MVAGPAQKRIFFVEIEMKALIQKIQGFIPLWQIGIWIFLAGLCAWAYVGADTQLQRDSAGFTIQGALHPGTSHTIALADTSKRNSTAFTARIVRVYCPEDCYINFGTSGVYVTSSNLLLPGGVMEYFSLKSETRIAGMAKASIDTLYITEME